MLEDGNRTEQIEVEKIDIEKKDIEKKDIEKIDVEEIDIEKIDIEKIGVENIGIEKIDIEKIDIEKIDVEEIDVEEIDVEERGKGLERERLQSVIEGILFTMGESVPIEQIAMAIEHDTETTRKIINQMKENYNQDYHGIMIMELENSYQMCTKKEIYEYLVKIAKQPKKYILTDVLLETLSIIAYKQPVTKLEIEKIRGVKSDHAVNKLVEFTLVEEVGRLDAPGRPIQFGTTEEFLRRFGVSSMEDLPIVQPNQIEDFKAEAEDEVQLQLNLT